MASLSSINIGIFTNAKQFRTGLQASSRAVLRFGNDVKANMATAATAITAALAAAGVASAKTAAQFETSMTKIETLVGLSRQQVAGMRQDVLRLAGQTARAPKELADALFVVTSAGIRGKESLEILESSAKAAALGMGETEEIARATTAVMQAYGVENISAARATEVLLKTVREGNLEAASLAPTLGRVIGIASQVGVRFEEVGANIATFTRLGVNAEEATTALRGVLNAALKPSAEAAKALNAIGLSAEGLREQIREKGLQATLGKLIRTFGDSKAEIAKIIPNVRALSNVLGTAGAQGEQYEQILANINQETDFLNEGFKRVSETTEFKFNKSMAKLQEQMVNIGSKILPIVNKGLDRIIQSFALFKKLGSDVNDTAKEQKTDFSKLTKQFIAYHKALKEANKEQKKVRDISVFSGGSAAPDFSTEMLTKGLENIRKGIEKTDREAKKLVGTGNKAAQQLQGAVDSILSDDRSGAREVTVFQLMAEDIVKLIDMIRGPLNQAFGFLGQLVKNQSIAFENRAQAEQQALQDRFAAQLRNIEQEEISEEEKNKKIQALNEARYAAETALDNKQQKERIKIARKQAALEKAQAIFSTIINTIVAVTKVLPNLVLAGIIGSFGAAQTAAIAAQPLPAFEKGGAKTPGIGAFLVGEKGPEILDIGARSGRIINNRQTSGMFGGSQNIGVNIDERGFVLFLERVLTKNRDRFGFEFG